LLSLGSLVLGRDELEVRENGTVSLPCKAIHSQPNPTRQEWKFQKDGLTLLFYHANNDHKTSRHYRAVLGDSFAQSQAFEPATAPDAGDYFCEAQNKVGPPQRSEVVHMETSKLNVGGIVAAVVVVLIILGLVIFGIWVTLNKLPPSWSDRGLRTLHFKLSTRLRSAVNVPGGSL
ncbi:putative F11 receptor protein, partial [Naja naja]